jgi:Fe-S-cluster containining protein
MSVDIKPESIFNCQICGECCRGYGGTFVSEKDIEAISRFLNIDTGRFISEFCLFSGGRAVLAQGKNGYCILLDKHKKCTIHPVKPGMCKKWPFIESLLVDPSNWRAMASSCPGMQADAPEQLIRECVKKALSSYE